MNERGSITFWVLGLAIAVLFLGGLSVDLWRVMSERRELAAVADSAAAAGASALDVDHWRNAGEIRLVADGAAGLAGRVIAQHSVATELSEPFGVSVSGDSVQITLTREVDLTLLRILMLGDDPLTVRVISTARAAPSS
jgi:Flp pilus assembly protein TadG